MMRLVRVVGVYLLMASCVAGWARAEDTSAGSPVADVVHHQLTVQLRPKSSSLKVSDLVTLPAALLVDSKVEFSLHSDLVIDGAEGRVEKLESVATGDPSDLNNGAVPVTRYQITLPAGAGAFSISYHGKIHHKIARPEEESARSFSASPGLIDTEGVFLAASSHWFPEISGHLMSFKMTVALPGGWDAVSQGARVEHNRKRGFTLVAWEETSPQDDIYLVAGAFKEYSQPAGAVTANVFLRDADDALAAKYLEATTQYLALYEKMLGPYPYQKFALVENFWETGYGMPSFTLLGSKVIRFPFIIVSSYPHEILHNWWGNSVYVDYDTGNWAEGLTAYLADHLLKEQRGQGAEHRRDTLQKYTDFVSSSRDFPLTEFVARHSSATEAVGYGKALMLFHMLRRDMGDEVFLKALGQFYQTYKFRRAGFMDLQKVFTEVAHKDYSAMFSQWVQRSGAPALQLRSASARTQAQQYVLTLQVAQIQDQAAYDLLVPAAITLEGVDRMYQTQLVLNDKLQNIDLTLPARPISIQLDPEFDVFRRLHSAEIPAALSQGFGAEQAIVVLPASASVDIRNALQKLVRQWQQEQQITFQVVSDDALQELPDAAAVWIMGWDNKFIKTVPPLLDPAQASLQSGTATLDAQTLQRAGHQVVLSIRHPANAEHTLLWIGADNVAAIENLARKLPHYRKYSYLAFAGDDAQNVAKGQWRVTNSPMVASVVQQDGARPVTGAAELAPREPLAQLPPVFSQHRLRQDVDYLAHKDRQGRGVGSVGLQQAGDYIAEIFTKAGLQPGGDNGTYFQSWSQDLGAPVGNVQLRNVIGILPGSNPRLTGESVVVSAHYDHLGNNWPGARKADAGKLHPGADDNASGVAVLLEYVRAVSAKLQAQRSVVFIAFTGEEWDRAGSRYYVEHAGAYPAEKAIGIVNMDTVGRIGNNPVTVIGTGSAREWVHILRGAGFVTGVKVNTVDSEWGSSDQRSFYDKGVSGIQLFGSAHKDFHRPSDTVDKIDVDGMVKVCALLKETVEYLSQRPEPLNVTLPDASSAAPLIRGAGARTASLGTVPDYAWQGTGVRIADVENGAPAQQAGLQAADIITAFDGIQIDNLRTFAQVLSTHAPGDTIAIQYKRGAELKETRATLVAR